MARETGTRGVILAGMASARAALMLGRNPTEFPGTGLVAGRPQFYSHHATEA
jgi:hypothetical protein